MPGITGIIAHPSRVTNQASVKGMIDTMVHEIFYNAGSLADEDLGVWAGWVAHAGSYSDAMPVWNEAHDICLIFTGEHFSDLSEESRLKGAGHQFTPGNASKIVHLYEELGPKFFAALNGTFSGLIIDRRENKVILFNDRYGLGRIYYHESTDGFYFSSEAKALLKVLPHLRTVDQTSLGEWYVIGCTMQHRSLFSGISLLPPGQAWTFRKDRSIEKVTYFDEKEWEGQTALDAEHYYDELKATFNRILPRYFSGGQKIALSITGGLDSRMIIAGGNFAPGTLPCFTFGGMYRDSEDVKVGRQVARLCNQPHHVIKVDESFFPQFLTQAQRCVYITDGTMDVSGSVGMVVNRGAREFGNVRMTGNYGSEILRRNVAFKVNRVPTHLFSNELVEQFSAAGETYRQEKKKSSPLSFIAFKQVPWHHYSRLSEEQSQVSVRAPYLDNELVRLAYRAPEDLLLNKQLAYRYTTDMKPALAQAPTDRGRLDRPSIVPTKVFQLWKELRPKAEYYYDYGMPNWFAKVDRMTAPLHLEKLFLGQQKYYHFRIWYRNELSKVVKDVLLDPVSLGRSYLNRKEVERIVNAHTSGSGNYTTQIHKLMSCEFIHRAFAS